MEISTYGSFPIIPYLPYLVGALFPFLGGLLVKNWRKGLFTGFFVALILLIIDSFTFNDWLCQDWCVADWVGFGLSVISLIISAIIFRIFKK